MKTDKLKRDNWLRGSNLIRKRQAKFASHSEKVPKNSTSNSQNFWLLKSSNAVSFKFFLRNFVPRKIIANRLEQVGDRLAERRRDAVNALSEQ